MHNSEQFNLYTAKIFEILFENFPVSVGLDKHEIIDEFLTFNEHESLKELRTKKDFADIVNMSPKGSLDDELIEKVAEVYPELKKSVNELEVKERYDKQKQLQILDGTIDFLLDEGFISSPPTGGYRLTSKSFSHLNKTFEKGEIESENSSYISAIKSIFSKSSDVTEKVAIGLAVKVILTLLGIS